MRKQRMVIDFHVLQTVPPSCVNRDDTGSPKTAVYGGVTRARVSSQAWKHAMRAYFMDELEAIDVGQRTKRIVELVAEEIARLDPALDSEKLHLELRDVVAEARDLCRQSTLFARRRGIGVRFSSNVPELRMLIDVEKLRSMLNNLLSNALRFTEDGGSVEVSCVASAGELELRVRDHGCGIPVEMQEKIFENGVTDGGHGYGLGIARSYARLLGGDISLKSTPGEGSCFILRLPVMHAPEQIN